MATLAYTDSALNSVLISMNYSTLPSELFTTIKSLNICQVIPIVKGCCAETKRWRSIAVITTYRSGSCTYQHKQASRLGVNKNTSVKFKCNCSCSTFENVSPSMLPLIQDQSRTKLCLRVTILLHRTLVLLSQTHG